MNTLRLSALFTCALAFSASVLNASLIYYVPFDSGSDASLANTGTVGGTGSAVAGTLGASAPYASQVQVAPNLGSTWSEYFPTLVPTDANNRGGAVLLPTSTDQLRLSSSTVTNQMTLSTWVYWNGTAGGTVTSPAGIAGSMNGANNAGWSLKILNPGAVRFQWVQTNGLLRNRDTTAAFVTAGQWVNVSLVFNSSLSQPAAIYINGVLAATTGSSGDPVMGIMKSDSNPIALGLSFQDNGTGRQSLNGYMDDFAAWDAPLSAAKIKAINTTPALLTGYNAGVMNNLFNAYDSQGSTVSGSVSWTYAAGFDASGRALGDTWLGSDGKYYLWLEGASSNALGLMGSVSQIPEPGSYALVAGASLLAVAFSRRPRKL
jgi:hypothetical protein